MQREKIRESELKQEIEAEERERVQRPATVTKVWRVDGKMEKVLGKRVLVKGTKRQ